jgi:hypothetical protein
VNELLRRVAAGVVAIALVVLVTSDLWVGSVHDWWDRHSLTGSVVANLLVLAVTALIVDEVVARRQRRERGVSVAVQGLIVYNQARRVFEAVSASGHGREQADAAPEELRTLTTMLLTASSSLFDDREARRFLEQAERCTGLMVRVSDGGTISDDHHARLSDEMARLRASVGPLRDRIPSEARSLLEDPPPN